MRIGDRRVGLRVSGLPDLPAGSVYQLWLAGPDGAVPGDTFTVGPGGATELIFVAPAFAERYTEMMVTVERAGGAETPSAEIVLDAKL
jgi:hypothetical protein